MDKIVISEQFSTYPMGRTNEDGPDNGERFFKEFLQANLKEGRKTAIVFDGVRSFGSSFLDQVFYVMPKKIGCNKESFENLVSIEAKGRAYQFYKKMAQDFSKNIPS